MIAPRRVFLALVLIGIALPGGAAAAAKGANNFYVIAHVDIAGAGNMEKAVPLIQQFIADSLKDPGALRFEFLQQDSRKNHFTIVEVWSSRKAFEAHTAAEHTVRFRGQLDPMLGSPYDERLNSPLP